VGQPLEVHIRKLQDHYWSEADPDGRGFVCLADALRRAGDLREAHRLLRDGLGRHPDFLSAHVVAGWLSIDRGQLGEAEDRFRTALDLDSRNVSALRGLAEVLLDRGEEDSALGFLEALCREDPVDLTLPERILELRTRSKVEEDVGPGEGGEPEPRLWDDPEEVAEELDWESAALQPDASASPEEETVPVELLAPAEPLATVPVELLAPAEPLTTVEIASPAAPAPEPVDVVPIEALAPDRTHPAPVRELAPERFVSLEVSAPREPVAIGTLAPDGPIPIGALAPEGPVPIGALAPEGPIPIEFLAPDKAFRPAPDGAPQEGGAVADPTIDAFERWLENLS